MNIGVFVLIFEFASGS